MTVLPEPPDGTRIEFEAATDLEAAHRDDAGSVRAGWPADHGWLVYGRSVPMTWAAMLDEFGYHALRYAVRLVPVEEDAGNRGRWPTVVYAETGVMGVEEHPMNCYCSDCSVGGDDEESEADRCAEPCDHCRPDLWHGCVKAKGHSGYHGCQP